MLRELSETLGGRWLSHEAKVFGLRAAEAGIARTHALSREEPFDEDLAFLLDEKVRARLGEDGPRDRARSPPWRERAPRGCGAIPECVDGDIADGHQSAAAVVVVCHAFHHTRNAVHSDRVS